MNSHEAISEFAQLLSVGSAALRSVVDNAGPRVEGGAAKLLAEVEQIAARLEEIARLING